MFARPLSHYLRTVVLTLANEARKALADLGELTRENILREHFIQPRSRYPNAATFYSDKISLTQVL